MGSTAGVAEPSTGVVTDLAATTDSMPSTRQATTTGQRGLGAMFPKLAAGIDAMTGGGRQPRDATDRFDEAVATDDPSYQP